MNTFYLICFVLGLILSLLAAFSGLGRLHIGHFHMGHLHTGHPHTGQLHTGHGQGAGLQAGHGQTGAQAEPGHSAFNGFSIAAFLCWFGGAGYLLANYTSLLGALVLLLAAAAGLLGAAILYTVLFKLLLPRERVLLPEDTRMQGTLARVSDEVRADGGIGEILFSQTGARRSAPARSEDNLHIPRDTEVVVLRYERGVAYIRPLNELADPGDALTLNR